MDIATVVNDLYSKKDPCLKPGQEAYLREKGLDPINLLIPPGISKEIYVDAVRTLVEKGSQIMHYDKIGRQQALEITTGLVMHVVYREFWRERILEMDSPTTTRKEVFDYIKKRAKQKLEHEEVESFASDLLIALTTSTEALQNSSVLIDVNAVEEQEQPLIKINADAYAMTQIDDGETTRLERRFNDIVRGIEEGKKDYLNLFYHAIPLLGIYYAHLKGLYMLKGKQEVAEKALIDGLKQMIEEHKTTGADLQEPQKTQTSTVIEKATAFLEQQK